MHLSYYLSIILDEIAAEGLEGITFECLWKYLSVYSYFTKIDDEYKEFLWIYIRQFSNVNFFKLQDPRKCNFKIKNRLDQYNFECNFFVEDDIPTYQLFNYHQVSDNDVFGSCTAFDTRILIDNEIKSNDNLSYSEVMEKYGNTLIMVAKQDYRFKFLGLSKSMEQLGKPMYAMLELIGRSRFNGIKAIGSYSALEFIKDAQVLWYLKKMLKSNNLIQVQSIEFLQPNKTSKEISVFHIPRFYRAFYNIFDTNMEKVFMYMSSIASAGILKSAFIKTLELSEEFLQKATQLGWLECVITSYRKLNQTCDIDQFETDEEILKSYISDYKLPKNHHYPLSLIDKRSCFIKPLKTVEQLAAKSKQQYETTVDSDTDEEPEQDVVLANKFIGMNLEEPLHIQVLKLIAQQPMSEREIKVALGIKKQSMRGLMRDLKHNDSIVVNFKAINRHSIPYYTIRQTITEPQPNNPMKSSPDGEDLIEEPPDQYQSLNKLTPAQRNPKRQDRYNYIVKMLRNNLVIAGHHFMKRAIHEWESSRQMKEVMDRKSYERIIKDAVKDKLVKEINVELKYNGKNITEKWLILPGITRDHENFKEQYMKRLDELNSKNKHVVLVATQKRQKKKKRFGNKVINFRNIDILKEIKNIHWIEETTDLKFPELPLMLRRKLLHEFIWYMSIGCQVEPNINFDPAMDQCGFKIFIDSTDWKRFVAPLPQDPDDKCITFNLNDLLLRMPLCLLCVLAFPKECNKDLYECLNDENMRLATLENLSTINISVVAFILNSHKRLALNKLLHLLESLMNMGLISVKDQSPPIRFKEDASFIFHREVFLTDTTKYKLPMTDRGIWRQLPRYQWVLKTALDVINYWENVYNVCTNTRCDINDKVRGLLILSNVPHASVRNNEFIEQNIKANGALNVDDAENILQLGAWVPSVDNIHWKNLGPGGFTLSLSTWPVVAWCQNRFDNICSCMRQSLSNAFNQFRTTLFTEAIKNLSSYVHISSLNESLSLILTEINIIVTAASILRYDNDLHKFWDKIRSKKWFKSSFTNVRNQSMHTMQRYIASLSNEHANERKYLFDEAMQFPAIESYSKIVNLKQFREQSTLKEAVIIRSLLLNLLKLHRFIPQWHSVNDKQYTINQTTSSENDTLMIDVLHMSTNTDDNRKIVRPDVIETLPDIAMLTIGKYLLGCLPCFKEPVLPDIEARNAILRTFSKDMLLSAINGFKNFYVLEPLKANKTKGELIKSGALDNRLSKLSGRLNQKSSTELNQYFSMISYLDGIYNDNMDIGPCTRSSGSHLPLVSAAVKARFRLDAIDSKEILFLMAIMTVLDDQTDSLTFSMEANNFSFDDFQYDAKSVCQSSMYSINLKMKNIAHFDWAKLIENVSFTLKLSCPTYQRLFHPDFSHHKSTWDSLTQLTTPQSLKPKRIRTRSINDHSDDDLLDYIELSEYGGRNWTRLQIKFADTNKLLKDLEKLIKEDKIYLVGLNTPHFVHCDFIRPWLVKKPQITDTISNADSNNRKRKNPSTDLDDGAIYFIPEFYRSETGEFKSITFTEILNRMFNKASKYAGCTLDFFMNDFSILIGALAMRRMIDILVKFEVLSLVTLKKSGNFGLFQKRVTYELSDYNPYDHPNNTIVKVNPLCHFNMINLLSDLGRHFSVDLLDYITSNKND